MEIKMNPVTEEERRATEKRIQVASAAIQKLLKEDAISPEECPRVAILGSGGGYRAMISTVSFLDALAIDGFLDTATYVSGVSGSTWALAGWMMSQRNRNLFLNQSACDPWQSSALGSDASSLERVRRIGNIDVNANDSQRCYMNRYDGMISMLYNRNDENDNYRSLLLRAFGEVLNSRLPSVSIHDVWRNHISNIVLRSMDRPSNDNNNYFETAADKCSAGCFPIPLLSAVQRSGLRGHGAGKFNWIAYSPYSVDVLKFKGKMVRKMANDVTNTNAAWLMASWGSAYSFHIGAVLPGARGLVHDIVPARLVGLLRDITVSDTYGEMRDAGVDINVPFPIFEPQYGRPADILVVIDSSGGANGSEQLGTASSMRDFWSMWVKATPGNVGEAFAQGETFRVFRPSPDHPEYPIIIYVLGNTTESTFQFDYGDGKIADMIKRVAGISRSREFRTAFKDALGTALVMRRRNLYQIQIKDTDVRVQLGNRTIRVPGGASVHTAQSVCSHVGAVANIDPATIVLLADNKVLDQDAKMDSYGGPKPQVILSARVSADTVVVENGERRLLFDYALYPTIAVLKEAACIQLGRLPHDGLLMKEGKICHEEEKVVQSITYKLLLS